LILIAAVPVGAAQAGGLTDRIIKDGEQVDEDITIYGGNLVIEKGASVNGNIVVFGGHAEIAGDIDGDVAIFGGNVELTGAIDGELVIFGGNLEERSLAEVDGD
jgi:hypothetical protein